MPPIKIISPQEPEYPTAALDHFTPSPTIVSWGNLDLWQKRPASLLALLCSAKAPADFAISTRQHRKAHAQTEAWPHRPAHVVY